MGEFMKNTTLGDREIRNRTRVGMKCAEKTGGVGAASAGEGGRKN